MSAHLALLLAVVAAAGPAPCNLDFRDGRLTHWQGQGFYVTTGSASGPSLACGVCSSDCGRAGWTALLYRTFVVPAGAGAILFTAAAVRPDDCEPGPVLDVRLEAAGGRFIELQTSTTEGWRPVASLLPRQGRRPRQYLWRVGDLVGQPVRIVLVDADDRPGCHVWCSGFSISSADEIDGKEFAHYMVDLVRKHELTPVDRLDSRHFVALGNAPEEFLAERLCNCETIYPVFLDHFRRKGFDVNAPGGRLMVAVFDSQAAFEACIGQRMSAATTGIYHRLTNRLVVYDYAGNRSFSAVKKQGQEQSQKLANSRDRQRYLGSLSQRAQVHRADANIGTVMHEVAHQLSFNCGLLNREGDAPAWLVEGLACYCEATENGSWQGVGEANPMRAQRLAGPARGAEPFVPLRVLLGGDDWLRHAKTVDQVLLGYSQSWALFRMLMEQRPRALKKYLAAIYPRRTPEYRLADFAEAFGAGLDAFEARYQAYMRRLAREQVRTGR